MSLVLRRAVSFLFVILLAGAGGPETRAQRPSLPDTLTFERATALLLEHNPRLRAARARVQTESASARVAPLFPNPTLGLSRERTPLPGDGGADDEWFLSLTQPLDYPGEHSARQRAADAARRAAEARLQGTRTSLYNDPTSAAIPTVTTSLLIGGLLVLLVLIGFLGN